MAILGYTCAFDSRSRRRAIQGLTGEPSQIPAITTIDAKLLGGAVIFGIGWGLVGLCPAPAIVRIGFLDGGAALFVLAMGLGTKLCDALFGLRDPCEGAR